MIDIANGCAKRTYQSDFWRNRCVNHPDFLMCTQGKSERLGFYSLLGQGENPMADTDLEKWKLVIQAVAALGGLSAMATLILALNQRRRPKLKLWLNSSRGESFGFGDYDKGEPTYFYHIIAKNMRIRVAENVGLLLTRVSKATAEGAFPDGKLPGPVRFRWARMEHTTEPGLRNIFNEATCNLGHIMKPNGYFQLNVIVEPLPPTFFVYPGERMRVDVVAEGAQSNTLSIEITWDGQWCDNPEDMENHMIIREIGLDHGAGHSLLLLCDANAPHCQKSQYFKGLGHYPCNTILFYLEPLSNFPFV